MSEYNHIDWSYYNKFEDLIDARLPARGEGDTAGTQALVAVNKLIYKWYNDGDVFDNTHDLDGFGNDLSSYANWLRENVPETAVYLDRIEEIPFDGDYEYENLLKDLADFILSEEYLYEIDQRYDGETVGTIYDCDGPFAIIDRREDDEEEYEEEEEEEKDYEYDV